jgi:spore maturation protein SpmB
VKRLACELKKLMGDTFSLYGELLKVMIPVMILVRLAVEFGAIEFVGKLIAPVMGWVGLPGEMGFVWVTAMIVNIYAGAAALLTILPECPLTIAQATILGSMILIAHSLPIEQRIAQKAGAGLLFTLGLRLIAAMVYGIILSIFYSGFPEFQQPAEVVFLELAPPSQDWLSWAVSSIKSLWSIFWIIFVLLCSVIRVAPAGHIENYSDSGQGFIAISAFYGDWRKGHLDDSNWRTARDFLRRGFNYSGGPIRKPCGERYFPLTLLHVSLSRLD